MRSVKIKNDINDINNKTCCLKFLDIIELLIEFDIKNLKYYIRVFASLFIICMIFLDLSFYNKITDLKHIKKYVHDCKHFIMYDRNKIYNKYPYIAVCLSALDMEKYIEKNLISILNQSFQDFEIIVVNDASKDETENIIKRIQLSDDRIKLVTHRNNLGVYRSRIESILNSKSEFVLLMDPDDMYLNEHLFKELHDYNIQKNLDIIEFSVYQQIDGSNKIYFPNNDFETHYHNFGKEIITQPELSNLLYYLPGTKQYSYTICRNIWNKMIRRERFIQTHNYIGTRYYNEFIITADDMIMNIVTYQLSQNYSNINLPGYLYIIRKLSMSRGDGDKKLKKIRAMNHLFYFKLFYKYIQDYHKDINYLYYEMKDLHRFILAIKDNNMIQYIPIQKNLIQQALKEKNISNEFKEYLQNLLEYYKN